MSGVIGDFWALEANVSDLREYWADGLSAAEIGRRMGISKNSVVGKAHRLNLLSRPSPIKTLADGPVRRVRNRSARSKAEAKRIASELIGVALKRSNTGRQNTPVDRVALPPVALPKYRGRSHPCSYPFGTPGTAGFRFCDEASLPGKSYCAEHHALCFVAPNRKVKHWDTLGDYMSRRDTFRVVP